MRKKQKIIVIKNKNNFKVKKMANFPFKIKFISIRFNNSQN